MIPAVSPGENPRACSAGDIRPHWSSRPIPRGGQLAAIADIDYLQGPVRAGQGGGQREGDGFGRLSAATGHVPLQRRPGPSALAWLPWQAMS